MNKVTRFISVCLLFGAIIFNSCSSDTIHDTTPLVETTSGTIAGYMDGGVFAFKGIPYARADRFMPPEDPEPWDGVRESTEFGPTAMQVNTWSDESDMDEDELFTVNVWTQGVNDDKKRPVMFWLHGGGFHVGGSDDPISDGHMLALTGDVVVVSVNHRLNILGFLDLSDFGDEYAHSANVGMLDVVAALQWVNRNIERFGGDPENITIFGESGGGGKVATLMCMPEAAGLFHKAIIQSGTLVNVMDKEKSTAIGRAVVENLGISGEQVSSLDTIPYSRLVEIGNQALEQTVGMRTPGSREIFGFGPVPDGINLLQQPFTPGFSDISKDVPLLIGTTLNEMERTAYADKDLTPEEAIARLEDRYGDKTDEYVALYEKAYPEYTPQDLLSIDTVFRPYTIMVADAWSETSEAPVYSYLLTWKSPVDDGARGSFHGLDIPLVFNNIELGKHWTGDEDDARQVADVMSASWIQFARTGDPNVPNRLPDWKPYSQENGETMIFDTEPEVVNNHDRALMNLIYPIP
ncbi:carboxylesterase/lipase family protein [Balneolales bacterium ANBcel1]|nr:carboxylesterase/lipase family protein [Balneolales bacterium ANBcel1]